MNTDIIITYWNEIISLFIEMSSFLIIGFIISGFLFIVISKEIIANNLGQSGLLSVIKASIFGIPMPLCSCGVIPVATSLYNRGASKGATLSFLISTPQTGIDSILITYGMLGPFFAIARPIIALITGVVGGLFADKLIESDSITNIKIDHEHPKKTLNDALKYAFITLPQDIAWPLVKGILIAGLITILIPNNFFQEYGITGWYALIVMAIASIPMYVCATASVPIAAGLILSSNLEPGAALVFLMAGPATNAATISVINKTLGNKIVYIYLSTIFVFSIIFGALINKLISVNPNVVTHHMHHINWFNIFCAILLLIICFYAIISKFFLASKESASNHADISFIVKGMTCNHCKETVYEAINTCNGVKDSNINLESGEVLIFGKNLQEEEIISSINNVGFSVGKNN